MLYTISIFFTEIIKTQTSILIIFGTHQEQLKRRKTCKPQRLFVYHCC